MLFGMTTFTFVHVVLSLLGILSGFVVVFFGFLTSRRLAGWTALFLATTIATSVTGFGFARDHLLPSHVVGIISLVFLAFALLALYRFDLARGWRRIYVISAVVALYLNFFVLIAQAFQKIPALNALAPTQTESPFIIAQATALIFFLILGTLAVKQFHPKL